MKRTPATYLFRQKYKMSDSTRRPEISPDEVVEHPSDDTGVANETWIDDADVDDADVDDDVQRHSHYVVRHLDLLFLTGC